MHLLINHMITYNIQSANNMTEGLQNENKLLEEAINTSSLAVLSALNRGSSGSEHDLLNQTQGKGNKDLKAMLEYDASTRAHCNVFTAMLNNYEVTSFTGNRFSESIPYNPGTDFLRGMQIDPMDITSKAKSSYHNKKKYFDINLFYKYTNPNADTSLYPIDQVVKADMYSIPFSSELTLPLNFHKIGLLNFTFLPYRTNTKNFMNHFKDNIYPNIDFINIEAEENINGFDVLTYSYDLRKMMEEIDNAMISYLTIGSSWSDKLYEWKKFYEEIGLLENENPITHIICLGKVFIEKRWYYLYTGSNRDKPNQKPRGLNRLFDYLRQANITHGDLELAPVGNRN